MRWAWISAAVVITGALAGCGSDDEDGGASELCSVKVVDAPEGCNECAQAQCCSPLQACADDGTCIALGACTSQYVGECESELFSEEDRRTCYAEKCPDSFAAWQTFDAVGQCLLAQCEPECFSD